MAFLTSGRENPCQCLETSERGVSADGTVATVAGGCCLLTLWILCVMVAAVCCGSMGICIERRMASRFTETSVRAAKVQFRSQFSCREVYADCVAERVEQQALSRVTQSQMELWSVRQQGRWASAVSDRLRSQSECRLYD